MIHDPQVEVTCDAPGCASNDYVDLHAGARDTYLCDDRKVEKELTRREWVIDDGKHYCCKACAEEAKP